MRWRFPDPNDFAEERARQAIIARIDAWWEAFRDKSADLDALFRGKKRWDLPAWMNRHLGAIAEHLMWEFGPAEVGHRLVITPESHKHLHPLLDVVLGRAPRLPGWTFLRARLHDDVEIMNQTVEAKTGEPLGAEEVVVSAGEANAVDLAFVLPEMEDEDAALARCFYGAESLCGEELLDKWIGLIEPVRRRPKGHRVPLERLRETVAATVEAIRDQMPAEPLWRRDDRTEYSGLQLQPEEAEDYPGRTDLIVAMTRWLEPWQHFHGGRSFYSERFSRCGEKFCYLKLDSSDWPREDVVEFRTRIEDPLDEALRAAGLGTTTGGGSGIRYSYIDLVLGNIEKAIPLIREVCSKVDVPKRSWLLFWDCVWSDEWVGLREETPPPPTARDE